MGCLGLGAMHLNVGLLGLSYCLCGVSVLVNVSVSTLAAASMKSAQLALLPIAGYFFAAAFMAVPGSIASARWGRKLPTVISNAVGILGGALRPECYGKFAVTCD